MTATSRTYRAGIGIAGLAIPILTKFSREIARGHAGRRASLAAFRAWSADSRNRTRPLVWFHASSVGEALSARPVVRLLREAHPEWQVAFTFFSPSATVIAESMGADITGYVPYDTADAVRSSLAALSPDALIFCRGDIWPELATQAHHRQTRVGIIAATVRPHSGRLRWPVRRLARPGYEVVQVAGAVSESDATRLAILGVTSDRVRILGDPRYDSVMEAMEAVSPDDPLLGLSAGAPTLVAGSTWPADEDVLLHAFAELRDDYPAARLILAPHRPTGSHVTKVLNLAHRLGHHGITLLGEGHPQQWRILVVDRVGVLARLYGSGSIAYVGGGFGRAGLHSVIEPAAWESPILFGPRWMESRDARLMIRLGGAADLPKDRASAIQRLVMYWRTWLENEGARRQVGQKARAIVERERGASVRCGSMIEELVNRRAALGGS